MIARDRGGREPPAEMNKAWVVEGASGSVGAAATRALQSPSLQAPGTVRDSRKQEGHEGQGTADGPRVCLHILLSVASSLTDVHSLN